VGTDFDKAPSSLLLRFGHKRHERWEKTVNSIEYSHSSHKVWSTINKLTGRSGHSSRLCSDSENSIASLLQKKGAHKTENHESTRLINKKLSKIWTVLTPEENSISGPFRPEEFASALRRLKPGKSLGMDSILLGFTLLDCTLLSKPRGIKKKPVFV